MHSTAAASRRTPDMCSLQAPRREDAFMVGHTTHLDGEGEGEGVSGIFVSRVNSPVFVFAFRYLVMMISLHACMYVCMLS